MLASRAARSLALIALFGAAGAAVAAAQPVYRVTITNLTRAQVFSPPVVVAHSARTRLFTSGLPASSALAELAEDGRTAPLLAALGADGEVMDAVAAGGPVPPGASVSVMVQAAFPFDHISAVGMLVQTNDSFFGLNGVGLPPRRSAESHTVPAYDAGSEANNEDCAFIPGPPCGSAGVRATEGAEGFVTVSNGIHGIGDLAADRYDWRNPVARITLQRVR